MPLKWKFFRLICILQLLVASFNIFELLTVFFYGISFGNMAGLTLFVLIIMISVLGINLVNQNYPDEPVQGKQKKLFNRLFLLNFLFLTILFAYIFAEYRSLKQIALVLEKPVHRLTWKLLIRIGAYLITLVFQFMILYGLFLLRRELYSNFLKQKFEFESP